MIHTIAAIIFVLSIFAGFFGLMTSKGTWPDQGVVVFAGLASGSLVFLIVSAIARVCVHL